MTSSGAPVLARQEAPARRTNRQTYAEPSSGSSGARCLSLFESLGSWVNGCERAFIESYYVHHAAASGASLNYEIRAAIKMALARANVP